MTSMVDLALLTDVSGSVRAINTARVLATIREEGPISRSELIARSGLSKATVSGIVCGLLERDTVREAGRIQPSRGRSRVLLEFNSASMTVIGVQVADDRCQVVRTDLAGSIIDRLDVAVDLNDVAKVTTTLARTIRKLADRPGRTVLGVGLGVPGVVDHSGRQVIVALSHNWHDVDLADGLEQALGLPVTLANRAKVAALGQLVTTPTTAEPRNDGATSGHPSIRQRPDLAYLYLGSGVVAGLVIGGRLHFGHDGQAGDLGHVMVEPNGPRCVCGTRGCLQALVGREAIVADAGAGTWDDLERAVHEGDHAALRAVRRAGDRLGMALGHLVAAVSPSVIAVGGPTACLGEPLLEAIEGAIRRCAPTAGPVEIVRADEDAPPRGAAMLWLQRAGLLA